MKISIGSTLNQLSKDWNNITDKVLYHWRFHEMFWGYQKNKKYPSPCLWKLT